MMEIVDKFIERFPESGYLRYHAPRYSTLVQLISEEYKSGGRILDIGRSKLTQIISDFLNVRVDSLGFQPDSVTTTGKHFHYNLNDSQSTDLWRKDIEPYDLIIFAEVIEHLYTSPNLVLSFINSITRKGGIVILQTPNAVVFHKRLTMLTGKNPFARIRENNQTPGHFREYTKNELAEYSINTGFDVKRFRYENYFDYRYSSHTTRRLSYQPSRKLFNLFYSCCPGSFKPGMTLVLEKK